MNYTTLVTGCAGFIGSTLVDTLLSRNEDVIGVDCFTDYYSPRLKADNLTAASFETPFRFYKSSVQELANKKLPKIDCVIHLAAYPGVQYSFIRPDLYIEHNIRGTIAALEIARSHNAKFLFASSSSVYGNCPKLPFVETEQPSPISVYGCTKLTGEQLCLVYHQAYDLDICCLRLFTCYGPRQRPDLAIRKFTESITSGEKIQVRGDGSTSRDYTYVDDIVAGFLKAREIQFGFEIINLGNNKPVSLSQMLLELQTQLGIPAKIETIDIPVGDALHTWADISKAQEVLGWQPQVEFSEGVRKFLKWMERTA